MHGRRERRTQRLAEKRTLSNRWRRWGPYLSERQWGTVREEYSEPGISWENFPHDHARRPTLQIPATRIPLRQDPRKKPVISTRHQEADEFYQNKLPPDLSPAETAISRQAYAGLLWSKQYYHYAVDEWLAGDPGHLTPENRKHGRNSDWRQIHATDSHWRDLMLFHEYFHAETGQGLGASHQTGWTRLIVRIIRECHE